MKIDGCCILLTKTRMTLPAWHEEPIGKHHERIAFNCGDEALNQFYIVMQGRVMKREEQNLMLLFLIATIKSTWILLS